ncbi:uncharacterized protein FIBRA_08977 [Fibroporia radiculosa]|uniref:Uncharacterized protein n=1 Tax=Fibroporia radiculosa TaxID=599839 RepID=J4GXQ6_9APHY|nr:uncharacterized protein FIBRA_08977 [Fibroporia radiculosa]CCM06690.1 predicted protein [Fibroporia radiculosa]
MFFMQRRSIHSVRFNSDLYKSPRFIAVRKYLEKKLKEYCKTSGLDAQGAHEATIVSSAHSGGTQRDEPFHITFRVQKEDGSYISTINPYTQKSTFSHHWYVAPSNQDLYNDAAADAKAAGGFT